MELGTSKSQYQEQLKIKTLIRRKSIFGLRKQIPYVGEVMFVENAEVEDMWSVPFFSFLTVYLFFYILLKAQVA